MIRRLCILISIVFFVGTWLIQAQERTPEATALPLTETYTSEDGSLTFQYPEEWILNPPILLYDVFSVHMVLRGNSENGILFYVGSKNAVASQAAIVRASTNGETIALANTEVMREAFLESGSADVNITQMGSVVQTTVGDADAVYLTVEFEDNTKVFVLNIERDNGTLIHLLFRAQIPEFEAWQSEVFSIAESITFSPTPEATALPLTETYTSEDRTVSFHYPEGWIFVQYPLDDEYRMYDYLERIDLFDSIDAMERTYDRDTLAQFQVGEVHISLILSKAYDWGLREDNNIQDVAVARYNSSYHQITSTSVVLLAGGQLTTEIRSIGVNLDEIGLHVLAGNYRWETVHWIANIADERILEIRLTTAYGELDHWLPTVLAIAESIQITQP